LVGIGAAPPEGDAQDAPVPCRTWSAWPNDAARRAALETECRPNTDGSRTTSRALLPIVFGMETARTIDPPREPMRRVTSEHFSNAGVDHPNPGENFMQLRWVVRR
jgi:hypothetical protein